MKNIDKISSISKEQKLLLKKVLVKKLIKTIAKDIVAR